MDEQLSAKPDDMQSGRTYAGRTPQQYQSERRQRLLDAALRLFTQRGYRQTPIGELCAEAGVSTRHFYQLYSDRDTMLCDLFDSVVTECGRTISKALAEPAEDVDQLVGNAIRAFIDFALQDQRRARLLCLEMVGVSEQVESHRRNTIRQITGLIADQASAMSRSGALPERDYYLPALMLTGAVSELLVEHLTAEAPPNSEDIVREMKLFFRAMMIGARQYPST